MKYIYIPAIVFMVFLNIALLITNANRENYINKEIKESRVREDLLLQEVKLLDYQIDVLTKKLFEE